jgi:hypothetical protein
LLIINQKDVKGRIAIRVKEKESRKDKLASLSVCYDIVLSYRNSLT